jgi:Arc/MetJ-type ribon-helix-helix transcriptional regulator
MKKLSVSLEPKHVDRLDDRQGEGDVSSRSAAVREILDEYESLRTECEDLRDECDNLRTHWRTVRSASTNWGTTCPAVTTGGES